MGRLPMLHPPGLLTAARLRRAMIGPNAYMDARILRINS